MGSPPTTPPRVMRGATAGTDGASGYVAKPAAGQEAYMLLGDGTWGAQPIAGLPSQTSNSGKLLTTDGTNAAWTTTGVLTSLTAPASTDLTLSGGSTSGKILFNSPSATERARLTSTGNLLIGTATDAANLAGGLVVNGSGTASAASNTTTGALRVTGGVGVSGAGYFGGGLNVTKNDLILSLTAATGTSANYLSFNNTGGTHYAGTDSSSGGSFFSGFSTAYSFNLVAQSGRDLFIGSGAKFIKMAHTSGDVSIASTTAASTPTSAALAVAGGIYAGAASVFGSTATFAGAVTIGGNVGFYNASPVAKPTGVAVTAAAIHAALVTLNLIAA